VVKCDAIVSQICSIETLQPFQSAFILNVATTIGRHNLRSRTLKHLLLCFPPDKTCIEKKNKKLSINFKKQTKNWHSFVISNCF
jgi:hypothetical protein